MMTFADQPVLNFPKTNTNRFDVRLGDEGIKSFSNIKGAGTAMIIRTVGVKKAKEIYVRGMNLAYSLVATVE